MSTQIAVRLDKDDIAFIDGLVERGAVPNRAEAVRRGLALLRREEAVRAERETVSRVDGPLYPDLDGMRELLAKRWGEPVDAHS